MSMRSRNMLGRKWELEAYVAGGREAEACRQEHVSRSMRGRSTRRSSVFNKSMRNSSMRVRSIQNKAWVTGACEAGAY